MSIKDFFLKKLIQRKLKNLPKDQQEMLTKLILENPEFFKTINNEIQEKTKSGMGQQAAMMQVMRKHQAELQKMMMRTQGGSPKQ